MQCDIEGRPVPPPRTDYYVYGYYGYYDDPNKPFYIGKGTGKRAWVHLAACKRSRSPSLFYQWLRGLFASGRTPVVRLLHVGMTNTEACDKEIELISRWGRIDRKTGCLTNQTDGGEGATGWVCSPELRVKRSEARKGKPLSLETRAKLSESRRGKTHGPEARAKISEAGRGRIPSPETLAKRSKSLRGKPKSPEHRNKIREALKGRRPSPVAFTRSSEVMKGKAKSPEHRAKISASLKGKAKSPEQVAKMSKPAASFSLATGETRKVYPSAAATASDGFCPSAIAKVCKGTRSHHKGLGWRYA